MWPRYRRSICILLVAMVIPVLLGFDLVSIQLRLRRNGAIADQLVESLRTQFPGTDFRGAAAYNQEVVYISVFSELDAAGRQDVEVWLRRLKTERAINYHNEVFG